MTRLKFAAVTAAIALLSFASSCGPEADREEKSPVRAQTPTTFPHIRRPNLVVADIDRALTIYRGVLGFTANDVDQSSKESFSYPVFNIDRRANLRSVTLNSPEAARVLALTEIKGAALEKPHAAPFNSAVMIGVEDLDNVIKALKRLDLQVTGKNETKVGAVRVQQQAFVDFDGHLISLYSVQSLGADQE